MPGETRGKKGLIGATKQARVVFQSPADQESGLIKYEVAQPQLDPHGRSKGQEEEEGAGGRKEEGAGGKSNEQEEGGRGRRKAQEEGGRGRRKE